ncbi:MAG TPA: TonB-dependent receptor plug domain-containing protein [Gemmatimonadales bacterium]|nr:TonB-dependent receptor plug domain-containing protein [Gemmatimonadales bacterium]
MKAIPRAALVACFLFIACSHRSSGGAYPDTSRVVLTADDIARSPGQSLEQLLQAHVPGLYLTRAPDGHTVVHMRGTTTLMGEDEPLFVVNGIPLGPNPWGNLTAINVHDIETVEVVRDAAATAGYGSRGANGVIIIKTKS